MNSCLCKSRAHNQLVSPGVVVAWDAINVACKPLSWTKAGSPIGSRREVAGEWGRSLFDGIISSEHFKLLDTKGVARPPPPMRSWGGQDLNCLIQTIWLHGYFKVGFPATILLHFCILFVREKCENLAFLQNRLGHFLGQALRLGQPWGAKCCG